MAEHSDTDRDADRAGDDRAGAGGDDRAGAGGDDRAGAGGDARAADGAPEADAELPASVVEEAERLTRLAREAVDEGERAAYRDERERLLAEHGFTARVRGEDDTLVLHPAEWVVDGTVRPARIDDVDRGIEVSLSGPGDPDDWTEIERHNADLVAAVRDAAGDVHGDNARAFADFMGNHYARRAETASAEEIREFLTEYYPRNAWPNDRQRELVGESIELLFEAADADPPRFRRSTR